MSYHSFIAGLSRLEQQVPAWVYWLVGGVLLYGRYFQDGWQQLFAAIFIMPALLFFISVSSLLLARTGFILSTLTSIVLILSLLARIHP